MFIIPQGAHNWGNRTIEQPLTVLLAARTIYPDLFADLDLNGEVKSFYQRFFNAALSDDQIQEIVSGKVGT